MAFLPDIALEAGRAHEVEAEGAAIADFFLEADPRAAEILAAARQP